MKELIILKMKNNNITEDETLLIKSQLKSISDETNYKVLLIIGDTEVLLGSDITIDVNDINDIKSLFK